MGRAYPPKLLWPLPLLLREKLRPPKPLCAAVRVLTLTGVATALPLLRSTVTVPPVRLRYTGDPR
jgi:hypothetical protein